MSHSLKDLLLLYLTWGQLTTTPRWGSRVNTLTTTTRWGSGINTESLTTTPRWGSGANTLTTTPRWGSGANTLTTTTRWGSGANTLTTTPRWGSGANTLTTTTRWGSGANTLTTTTRWGSGANTLTTTPRWGSGANTQPPQHSENEFHTSALNRRRGYSSFYIKCINFISFLLSDKRLYKIAVISTCIVWTVCVWYSERAKQKETNGSLLPYFLTHFLFTLLWV